MAAVHVHMYSTCMYVCNSIMISCLLVTHITMSYSVYHDMRTQYKTSMSVHTYISATIANAVRWTIESTRDWNGKHLVGVTLYS